MRILSAIPREKIFKMKNVIAMDTGAGGNVIPRRMVSAAMIVPSPGSTRGVHCVSCTNHRIPDEGQIVLPFTASEGQQTTRTLQIVDATNPMGCVADRVDDRCRLVLDQDDDTGVDLSHIYNKKTKKEMKLNRVGKVWVLDCKVTRDLICESNSASCRPGL